MLEKWINTLENFITTKGLDNHMWAHKFASKTIILSDLA